MLLTVVIGFSILAAFFNALSSVLQRFEAGQAEAKELFRSNFIKRLSTNKKWLEALLIELVAFIFQAAALKEGALIIVAPMLTVDLVFMMLILHFFKNTPVGKLEWLAIILICIGLSGMFLSADPKAGKRPFPISHLILVSAIIAVIIVIGIYAVRRTKAKTYRAAISGIAAGFSFALTAVFTKIVTRYINHGFIALLTSWQLWGLFLAGIISVIMAQNTYGAGPIAISQPAMELVEPIVGIILGIYLFGDKVSLNPLNLAFALFTAMLAATGIFLLSRSKRLQIREI
jgi:drug/metabolite transporter (DMT)-like permease